MDLNYTQKVNQNDSFQTTNTIINYLKSSLNCVKVGVVEEFYPDNLTVRVRVANKQTTGMKDDGTPIVSDYPPIYAKILYAGWKQTKITYPIEKYTEGVLLFNDREIESWFVNGEINPLAYDRKHDITDAIFIAGLHSMPNMIEFVRDCLNFVYSRSSMQISDSTIAINGYEKININTPTTNISNNLNVVNNENIGQKLTANEVEVVTGASGTFVSQDGKTITVTKGIVTNIN